ELNHMRDIERRQTALQPWLVRILQTGEATQPGHVVIGVGRVIDRLRPDVRDQELQPVGISLLSGQLKRMIDGVSNQQGFGRYPSELWERTQQLRVLNRITSSRQCAVRVRDDSRKGIATKLFRHGTESVVHGLFGSAAVVGKPSTQGPR